MTSLLAQAGLRFPDDADEAEFRREYVVRLRPQIQIAFVLGGLIYYIFFLWDRIIDPMHFETTHAIRAVLALVCLAMAVVMFWKKSEPYLEAIQTGVITVASLGLTAIYAILDRGFEYGGVGIVIVILFNLAMLRNRFAYVLVFSLVSWIAFIGLQIAVGPAGFLIVNNLVVGSAAFIGLFSVWNQERDNRRQFVLKRELRESREQIEELIFSMLPSQIVGRMRAGETSIADSYGEVSIVFADLVGFTQLARKVAPHHLVEILNKLFSKFDELAAQHRIEKIKTIGDAYMAVSGMDKGDSQHAERAAEFAFGMLRAVEDLSSDLGFALNVRIGLHVGPVIAGVIGTRKPAFDCWGDSVNIASRLESSGVSGGIQISESARWRLQHKYKVVENAEVNIKGIGITKTYGIYPQPAPA